MMKNKQAEMRPSKIRKVLVTGGAGFIGSNLCEALVNRTELEVISIDNYHSGTSKNHVTGVRYLTGDTRDINQLDLDKIDLVFHFGEYARVEQSFEDIEKVWTSNVLGTNEIIKYCLKNQCKLVYAGSSTKFADHGAGRHQSPYSWTKAANTELILNYEEWFGLEHAIVYFNNVYGKNEIAEGKYATLIGRFVNAKRNKLPLTIVKPGNQRRYFTHVQDVIQALLLVMKHGKGDGYQIGPDSDFSIEEVASMFGGDVVYLPERPGNRHSGSIDNSKLKKLGWEVKNHLPDYINELRKLDWNLTR